jgi:hypothetical protein
VCKVFITLELRVDFRRFHDAFSRKVFKTLGLTSYPGGTFSGWPPA